MDSSLGIPAPSSGPILNVIRADGESLPVPTKAEVVSCSFRVYRPGRIEVHLYPTIRRAQEAAQPGDDVVTTDDGRAWILRWIE